MEPGLDWANVEPGRLDPDAFCDRKAFRGLTSRIGRRPRVRHSPERSAGFKHMFIFFDLHVLLCYEDVEI